MRCWDHGRIQPFAGQATGSLLLNGISVKPLELARVQRVNGVPSLDGTLKSETSVVIVVGFVLAPSGFVNLCIMFFPICVAAGSLRSTPLATHHFNMLDACSS